MYFCRSVTYPLVPLVNVSPMRHLAALLHQRLPAAFKFSIPPASWSRQPEPPRSLPLSARPPSSVHPVATVHRAARLRQLSQQHLLVPFWASVVPPGATGTADHSAALLMHELAWVRELTSLRAKDAGHRAPLPKAVPLC
ncbi:hypothetical protein NDU88_005521 [Pleurodeles waltl]|uniref:Uncharacterized protein n=1 Tax=Pleurodeles waltl TaxID=8319 RepID=A0AAV7RJW4_PLEWA|nr:hypothetical protein NDU88_005521 [Pleurodeles waltl]